MAYRISEDERVFLPVLINMDGFYLSFAREPVLVPDKDKEKIFYLSTNQSMRFSKLQSQWHRVLQSWAAVHIHILNISNIKRP